MIDLTGSVTDTSPWLDDDGSPRVSPAAIAALTATYAAASWALSQAVARGSLDLWARRTPVNDAQLGAWLDAWDRLLAAAATKQARLTATYLDRQFATVGSPLDYGPPSDHAATEAALALQAWLDGPYARLAPDLTERINSALEAVESGRATATELAAADRTRWMHSPVIATRTALANGDKLDVAVNSSRPEVSDLVYQSGRQTEVDTIGLVRDWPVFKNGSAMLYKRVVQAGACGWCRAVATRLYPLSAFNRNQSAKWHAHCHCSWSLVTRTEAKHYATAHAQTGDYYRAAQSVGLWSGPPPSSSEALIAQRSDKNAYLAAQHEENK